MLHLLSLCLGIFRYVSVALSATRYLFTSQPKFACCCNVYNRAKCVDSRLLQVIQNATRYGTKLTFLWLRNSLQRVWKGTEDMLRLLLGVLSIRLRLRRCRGRLLDLDLGGTGSYSCRSRRGT